MDNRTLHVFYRICLSTGIITSTTEVPDKSAGENRGTTEFSTSITRVRACWTRHGICNEPATGVVAAKAGGLRFRARRSVAPRHVGLFNSTPPGAWSRRCFAPWARRHLLQLHVAMNNSAARLLHFVAFPGSFSAVEGVDAPIALVL